MISILIVDDEEIICESYKIKVKSCGLSGVGKTLVAYSGIQALEIIETEKIDIVLTDIKMPDMDGIELIKRINERHIDISCIVISGYGDYEYVRQAFNIGIVDYLLKPVSLYEIKEKLGCIIQNIKENTVTKRVSKSNLEKVYEYTLNHLSDEIDMSEIANITSMSYSYFSEWFKEETGENFRTYVLRNRMKLAKELLEQGNYKVSEVAARVGYQNAKNFTRAFRKCNMECPREFRDRKGVARRLNEKET